LSDSLYHHFFSQIIFVWLIISVSYCHLDLVVAFFLSILFVNLAIHFLSRTPCQLGLLRSFSYNFVCCLSLLDQGDKDILLTLSSSSHNFIPLLAICGSASHHLFGLTRRSGLHSMTTLKS
jgi:hypothetical protein